MKVSSNLLANNEFLHENKIMSDLPVGLHMITEVVNRKTKVIVATKISIIYNTNIL